MKTASLRTPAVLVILDGWGWREDVTHNAIAEANTPCYDHLLRTYPHAVFDASGIAVGLPEGQMGNSEIGHMSIGAGIPIDTDLVRINKAIADGAFSTKPVFREELFAHVCATGGTLHVLGLLSDGGIHSHEQHLYALLRAAKDAGVQKVLVHAFLDGRDAAPQSGVGYLDRLTHEIRACGVGQTASISGRYYAMDRDNNWERVDSAVRAICDGEATRAIAGVAPREVVTAYYTEGGIDEHFVPTVLKTHEGVVPRVNSGDAIILTNFRADRARMLARRLYERYGEDATIRIATMTEYEKSLPIPAAFPPLRPQTTLAGEISRMGLTQAHIAETEKYAHATYFLNGGRETPHEGEEFVLVESRKDVQTHDQAPEMRAKEIGDAVIARIEAGVDFIFVNFANADMVGHTANVPAIRVAVETIDRELARITDAVRARGGFVFITADHGNAEQNFDVGAGVLHTAHTLDKVPAILTDTGYTLSDGVLPDVAPTVLSLMGLSIPSGMTGVVRARRADVTL